MDERPRLKLRTADRAMTKSHPLAGRVYGRRESYNRIMDRMTGRSFRHPSEYRPIYPGLTDLEAFESGCRAVRMRMPLASNPYKPKSREHESWIDGWAWAGQTSLTVTMTARVSDTWRPRRGYAG